MSFGYGFGLPSWNTLAGGFSPASLFTQGEQGAWYDPSDLSTMFTDPGSGLQPVTSFTSNTPVNVLLDKSKGGVGTNGAEPYNRLTFTQTFSNAAWTKSNAVAAATSGTTDPFGGNTAQVLSETTANGDHGYYSNNQNPPIASGISYTQSLFIKKGNGVTAPDWVQLYFRTAAFGNLEYANFNVSNGTVGNYSSAVLPTIVSVGNGWWRCTLVGVATATTSSLTGVGFAFTNNSSTAVRGGPIYVGATTSNVFVWGADLRLTADAAKTPTYQPITSSWAATIPGNHATASGSARPVLSKRYNLLLATENLNGGWTKQNCTMSTGVADPYGGTTAVGVIPSNASNAFSGFFQSRGFPSGSYVQRWILKRGSKRYFWITTNGGVTKTYCDWDTLSGVSGNTVAFTALSAGWYIVTSTGTQADDAGVYPCDASNSTACVGDGVTVAIYCCKPDLRRTIDANAFQPAYQRVVTATDYDGDGFLPYLEYSGAQAMSTGSIDFTAGDKMSVWAGVTKLSDAADAILTELSATVSTNNGSFAVLAPYSSTANRLGFALRGDTARTNQITGSSPYAAPVTLVSSISYDIAETSSATEILPRVNGVVPSTSTAGAAESGTGNFGNYPLYIGARAASSLFFNGRQYSLIVRGAQSSDAQISATESWVNQRTGAY